MARTYPVPAFWGIAGPSEHHLFDRVHLHDLLSTEATAEAEAEQNGLNDYLRLPYGPTCHFRPQRIRVDQMVEQCRPKLLVLAHAEGGAVRAQMCASPIADVGRP